MSLRTHKTIWPFDRRWLRVEYRDHCDQPLGYVNFEPNPKFESDCSRRSVPRRSSHLWLACSICLGATWCRRLRCRRAGTLTGETHEQSKEPNHRFCDTRRKEFDLSIQYSVASRTVRQLASPNPLLVGYFLKHFRFLRAIDR